MLAIKNPRYIFRRNNLFINKNNFGNNSFSHFFCKIDWVELTPFVKGIVRVYTIKHNSCLRAGRAISRIGRWWIYGRLLDSVNSLIRTTTPTQTTTLARFTHRALFRGKRCHHRRRRRYILFSPFGRERTVGPYLVLYFHPSRARYFRPRRKRYCLPGTSSNARLAIFISSSSRLYLSVFRSPFSRCFLPCNILEISLRENIVLCASK